MNNATNSLNHSTNSPATAASTPDPLAQLRDIHWPDAIGWWPMAPGWWLLLGLIIISIASLFIWIHRRNKRQHQPLILSKQAIIQAALIEFHHINQQPTSTTQTRQVLRELSQLLRRCAIELSRHNQDSNAIAGLTGSAWLQWLDTRWDRHDFTSDIGQILLDGPYRQHIKPPDDLPALFNISRNWLEQQQ